ncbi:MAG: FkbM family methyltransferase [Candidatus Acidiferrales bacterium]
MSSMDQSKGVVRKLANQLGIDITRFDSKRSDRARLAHFLESRNVNLVFDVGANVGQYGRELRGLGYRGRIISFEPVAAAHQRLAKAAGRDPHWTVAPRTAIGSEDGVISINISANSVFNSVLQGANLLSRVDSKAVISEERVPLVTLNSLAPLYMNHGDVAFLKIDVQGFEYEVLHGADNILSELCGAQMELSLIPLYQGEKPFRFMLDFMECKGFQLHSVVSVFGDEASGGEFHLDAIFVRSGGSDTSAGSDLDR